MPSFDRNGTNTGSYGRRSRSAGDTNPPVTPPVNTNPRDFRADLEDLVVNSGVITGKTDRQMQKLDASYDKFNDFLQKKLVSNFKMSDADAGALTMEEKIAYMEKNAWKLSVPDFAPIMDEANGLVMEMRRLEADIRGDIDGILTQQEEITAKNDELLKVYHEQLQVDTKRAEDLEIENAGLIDTIPDIVDMPLYDEVQALKDSIDVKYDEIDGIRNKIEDKENDNITLSNEMDALEDDIRNESTDITKLNRQKVDLEKEITELNRELTNAKKAGASQDEIDEIQNRINSKKDERKSIDDDIRDKTSNIATLRSKKSTLLGKRNENLKAISTLNNEKAKIHSSLETVEKEHRIKLSELTKEREEDSEEVRKFKRNLKEIEKLDIANRMKGYKDKKERNTIFKRELGENKEKINDKFREYKIESPSKVSSNSSRAVAGVDGEGVVAPAQDGAQARGGAAGGAAGAPAQQNSLVPADQYADLSDRDLANNFYNDVVNRNLSPYEMNLRLSGYGFSTFVNACEHLSARQRKKILPILKERRVRLISTHEDELAFQRVFGDDVYKLVYDAGSRKPRDINTLTEEEVRSLSIAAEDFKKNLVDFSDDDIKVIESKFFDVLANSSVVDMYESSSTLRGRFTGMIDNLFNRQKVQVMKELRGTMCQYHREKADKFYTTDSRERKFKDILGRDTVRNPVERQINTNVPELTNRNSSLRNELNSRNNR